ncbi:MAG: hypothetical protein LLG01_14995 [Planctomycetaceae bacterium]|nr:hypothetical protein [Planctomycetaceae bacterium]
MANRPRTPLREVLFIIAFSPFALFFGFHVPLLANAAWTKLRIPYFVAMPLLFGIEMAAVDFLLLPPKHRTIALAAHGALLLLTAAGSVVCGLITKGRKRLMEEPGNLEGFVPAHILFILICLLVPFLIRAWAKAHGSH